MLMYPGNRGWPAFQALLRGLLRFLEPYLRNAQLTEAIRLLYKVRHRSRGRSADSLAFVSCTTTAAALHDTVFQLRLEHPIMRPFTEHVHTCIAVLNQRGKCSDL